jgi:hypothetical protein
MREEILKVIKEMGPKHFSRRIKNTTILWDWILSQTTHLGDDITISERIHVAISGDDSICVQGNRKKFKNIDSGYGFCAKTGKCVCAQQSVSDNVANAARNFTLDKKKSIQLKREQTSMERYGTTNNAQTDQALQRHKEFYNNPTNVINQVSKYRKTMIDRYGVDNACHVNAVRKKKEITNITKYGVPNPMMNVDIAKKSINTRKDRYPAAHYLIKSYERMGEMLRTVYNVEFITPMDDYDGVSEQRYYEFKCIICNHQYSTYIDNGHKPVCKICNPTIDSYKSGEEMEVLEHINGMGYSTESGNRTLINPYQLDIIVHDKKIAIEYCGLYWHSRYAAAKDINYHQYKMELCNKKEYRLITIFSDEWNLNKDLVKEKLNHIFGVSDKKRIFARKTEIFPIKSGMANVFYSKYHIQGKCRSKYHFGLFYNGVIVAAMSVGDLRKSMGSNPKIGHYELIRYASSDIIVGGASKLLAHFIRTYNPINIVSYADMRWSDGKLYNDMGFTLKSVSKPGYWYIPKGYTTRQHRTKFKKHLLVNNYGADPLKSERDIMIEMGYDVIYDCGQFRFELNLS